MLVQVLPTFVDSFNTDDRYTSSMGERRIRVHTMATPVVSDLSEMYRAADVGAITSLMSRLGMFTCFYLSKL